MLLITVALVRCHADDHQGGPFSAQRVTDSPATVAANVASAPEPCLSSSANGLRCLAACNWPSER